MIRGMRIAEDFSVPADGGSGLLPGVDLEDKEQIAELLGNNAPALIPEQVS